jgi:hypothetical protein
MVQSFATFRSNHEPSRTDYYCSAVLVDDTTKRGYCCCPENNKGKSLDSNWKPVVSKIRSVARLKRAGLAYVEFPLRGPEHFTVMFDAAVSEHKTPDSAQAAEQAFGTLPSLVKGCQDGVGRDKDDRRRTCESAR